MLPDWIERDVDLRARNTLALPASCALFAEVDSAAQLAEVGAHIELARERRFVLGGGSNVLLGGRFDGIVLHIAIGGRDLVGEDDDAWYVRAGAGENWSDFVEWTLQRGWPGLENLTAIPGSVGAAPIQNIGAYGREVGELIDAVEVFDFASGGLRGFSRADCRFAYRDSVFKQSGWHLDGSIVVTHVVFRLPKRWQALTNYSGIGEELAARGVEVLTADASEIAAAITALRTRKLPDPARLPNVGSFFHNPLVDTAQAARLATEFPGMPQHAQADGSVKLAAGWLIERAGWKGKDLGRVGMFAGQALVLVNHGGATAADVAALAALVAADVRRLFAVDLHIEPAKPGENA